jgi:hypothetical protein
MNTIIKTQEKLLELRLEQKKLEKEICNYPKPSKNQKYLQLDNKFKDYNKCRDKLVKNREDIARCKLILGNKKNLNLEIDLCKKILKDNFSNEQMKLVYTYIDSADISKTLILKDSIKDKISFLDELKKAYKEIQMIRLEMNLFMNEHERILSKSLFADFIKKMSSLNKSIPNEKDIQNRIIKLSKQVSV